MLVAVVDDDVEDRLALQDGLAEAGYATVVREAQLDGTHDLLSWLRDVGADALACDHRLTGSNYARFTGADGVSEAYRELQLPGFLTSAFIGTSGALEIQRQRRYLPSVVRKRDWAPSVLRDAIEFCERELAGDVPIERRPSRTGIEVVDVHSYDRDPVAVAFLPGWQPKTTVHFALDLIEDRGLRELVHSQEVQWLFARVNIGAEGAEELFFSDFEPAPDPVAFIE